MLLAGERVKKRYENGGLIKMMKFLIGAVFCGAGALFPFLLINDDEGGSDDEV